MGVPHKESRQISNDTGWRGFGMWITLFWIKGICFYIRIVKPFKPFFMLLLDNENQQNKNAYLVKLTDARGDICAFLIDGETANTIDNDEAVMIPGTDKVLDGDINSYERWYAQTKDIMEIVKNAQDNGYFVDLNDEFNFVHY